MNWDRVEQLLNIEEKTRGHGAALKAIHDSAWDELLKHNEYAGDPGAIPPMEEETHRVSLPQELTKRSL